MADPSPYTNGDTEARTGREGTTGTPRWVKVFGIILAGVVLLLVIVLLLGQGSLGNHGPGRHALSGNRGGPAPPSGITAVQAAPAAVAGHSSLEAGPG